MSNPEIAAVLERIADLLEFQGANPFRVRAYRNAARTIRDLPEPASAIVADPDRSLLEYEGIGKDLAEKISELIHTGTLPMLDELLAEIPEGVLAMLQVPGLGPKRAALLYRELHAASIDELRAACQSHRVQSLKGFGAKTEAAILKGLDIASEAGRRILWIEADRLVQDILEHMRECKTLEKLVAAGSYRRGKDTVGDLDFLAVARDATAAMNRLAEYGGAEVILARGDTKMSLRLAAGTQVDLRVVPGESFGAALQYFTGSKDHNVVLRGRAKALGLKVNEYGVFRTGKGTSGGLSQFSSDENGTVPFRSAMDSPALGGEERIAGRTEEEVYAAVGLPCFPPELREARREFDWADAGALPVLVELADIRGDLHMHSTWTDGTATIEEMAAAAKLRGLKYIAITDHSKRVAMVGGLDAAKLRRQWAEIDRLNERLSGFTVLKGVEVDILERGGLDLPDDLLAEADWVVASIHYGQQQPREQITRRAIEALENPHVDALAHPTGRMLLKREPYAIDLDAVMQAARKHGKFLELNAHPSRLDLDDVACAAAKNLDVPIVISTDAHRPEGLDAMRCGVRQARRGGLTKADVANARTWPQLKKMLGKH